MSDCGAMEDKLQECVRRFPITNLKPERQEAVECLLAGRDVLAILPTGFGKSLIYQVFGEAKQSSVLVISPLNSIVEEQVVELSELGFPAIHLQENDPACLKAISQGKFRFIFCSAERCLSVEFQALLKSESTRSDIELVVVDESHTVETWLVPSLLDYDQHEFFVFNLHDRERDLLDRSIAFLYALYETLDSFYILKLILNSYKRGIICLFKFSYLLFVSVVSHISRYAIAW